ncbi:MAG: hypothetical protein LZF62_480232 [Nitrospira sp.]|nr:MAG: hypothetical protein LZF62_480232 [Nitrospira sp.]
MSGETESHALNRALNGTRSLCSITVDHGMEFQSRALEDWAYNRGVQLDFIRPRKPVENAFIESFYGPCETRVPMYTSSCHSTTSEPSPKRGATTTGYTARSGT